jgi:hypothetical protein
VRCWSGPSWASVLCPQCTRKPFPPGISFSFVRGSRPLACIVLVSSVHWSTCPLICCPLSSLRVCRHRGHCPQADRCTTSHQCRAGKRRGWTLTCLSWPRFSALTFLGASPFVAAVAASSRCQLSWLLLSPLLLPPLLLPLSPLQPFQPHYCCRYRRCSRCSRTAAAAAVAAVALGVAVGVRPPSRVQGDWRRGVLIWC